jgi:hypothetical protein
MAVGVGRGDGHGLADFDAGEIESMRQAVELARTCLSDHLSIHEDAFETVDECDAAINSRAWAVATWRALRALHDYAQAGGGGFWRWCEQGGGWPATPKKLAMKESETVTANPRLRRMRLLLIDPAVGIGESVVMEAHMKISEGGGPIAPRIYFYDDTAGRTGKVHVGFIGPHRYMENKSTN